MTHGVFVVKKIELIKTSFFFVAFYLPLYHSFYIPKVFFKSDFQGVCHFKREFIVILSYFHPLLYHFNILKVFWYSYRSYKVQKNCMTKDMTKNTLKLKYRQYKLMTDYLRNTESLLATHIHD